MEWIIFAKIHGNNDRYCRTVYRHKIHETYYRDIIFLCACGRAHRIPPGAEVQYTVELVALPGKEDDILDLQDEPLTGPAFDSA